MNRAKRAHLRQVEVSTPGDTPAGRPEGEPDRASLLRVLPTPDSMSPASLASPALASPAREAAPAALCLVRIEGLDGDFVRLAVGGEIVAATRDASVHPAVLAGAHARGERVLAERDAGGAWLVVGALRTQPTPGVDVADAYTIEARRITLRADDEVTLSARAANVVLRAVGEVETYADRILSRAEGVHKIVGRILRLN